MRGHIKLGVVGEDPRPYMLVNPMARSKSLANPFAAKIGQGAGRYDDMQNFAAWVIDDWAGGGGQEDPGEGGYHFADVDSRVGGQLILAPALGQCSHLVADANRGQFPLEADTYTFTAVAANGTFGWGTIMPSTVSGNNKFWLYGQICQDTNLTVYIRSYAAGPILGTVTVTCVEEHHGYTWHEINTGYVFLASTSYYIEIVPDTAISIPVKGDHPFWQLGPASFNATTAPVMFNGNLYIGKGTQLYKWNAGIWSTVGSARGAAITSLQSFDSQLYIGLGNSTNFDRMSTGESFTADSDARNLFTQWSGYLWGSKDNDLYYTDGSGTWIGPIPTPDAIISMSGMENNLYFATGEGLYYVAPGDAVYGVTQWGGVVPSAPMVNFQGELYTSTGNQIVRYNTTGQVLNIWMKNNGDLPEPYVGKITHLYSTNLWLIAVLQPTSDSFYGPTLWMWQTTGWHHLATLPPGSTVSGLCYFRSQQMLFINGGNTVYHLRFADYAINPSVDTNHRYMPSGWLMTGKFDGRLLEINKDYESVYVRGTGLTDDQKVTIHWMDDDSTGWEELGDFDGDREEIRWSDYTTRPATKELELGLLLTTTDSSSTPKIKAIRTKYLPIVFDRWRWQVTIQVQESQELVDGSMQVYSQSEMIDHLESLITQTPPCLFEDLDGRQYEVQILDAAEQPVDYEYYGDDAAYKPIYSLSLEQVTTGEYVA